MSTQGSCTQCGNAVQPGTQYCPNCGTNVSAQQGAVATRMVQKAGATAQLQDQLLERLRDATLGDYEILTELGRGGMATVYLGHDLQLDRKVAIKVMLPELLEGEGMTERFKLEARTAAQLSHPHIIPIYAVRDEEQLLFFVMKFIEGRPLDSIVEELGKMPIPMAQAILAKVGEALGYAHRRGVVHRDIKPANLMIDVEGQPIVTDFGIAKVADTRGLTMTGATIGTPTYMSPEQCSAGEITGASDQYSLGVVAYQMLSGRLPFGGDSIVSLLYQHCHEPPPPFQDARPDCPAPLHDAVMKMLAKKPADRFPSLEAAVQAIGNISLSFDDPMRLTLVGLAKKGGNQAILQRISTPRSPTPMRSKVSKRTAQASAKAGTAPQAAAAATVVTATAPAAGTSRTLLWAGLATVAVAAAAFAVWQRPWERPAPPAAPAGVVARLVVQPTTGVLDVNGTLQLASAALDSAGQPVSAPITWSSDDPAVASVTPTGLVQGLAAGSVRIQAAAGTARGSAQLTVAVSAPPAAPAAPGAAPGTVATIRVDGVPQNLPVGGTAQLRALTLDGRGALVSGRPVSWSSSAPSLASVSQAGLVTALAPGAVTLTARSGSVSQAVSLAVAAPRAASVALSPAPGPLAVGATARLTATVRAEDGRTLGSAVAWRSADPRVATVSDGLVTAVGAGSTVITASADGREATTTVTVAAAEAPRPSAPAPAPAPAPAAPAPAADAREAIAAVIQEYARALESRQISEVRRAYPGMSAAQESQVGGFLASAEQLRVTLRVASTDVQGDLATAAVSGTYDFVSRENRRNERLPVRFQATLEQSAGGWRIRSIR